jgi:hypothetical protein
MIAINTRFLLCGLFAPTLFLLAVASVAIAQSVTDNETGVTITPPPGYTVHISNSSASRASNRQLSAVVRQVSRFAQCDIQIVRTHQSDQGLSQAERDKSLELTVRRAGNRDYEIATERFEYLNSSGIVQLGPKSKPDQRSAFSQIRIWLFPAYGMVVTSCATSSLDFDKRRPEFEAIVRGISLPN